MRALRYFAEYADYDNIQYRVEVWEEGFTGNATEVTMGGNPVQIERNKIVSEQYVGGIVPSFYRFEFVTSTGFNSSSFLFENYGDVIIKHFVNGALDFEAVVSPFVTQDPDLPAGYSVFTLSGECGVQLLRNSRPTLLNGNASLIALMSEALATIPRETAFPFKVVDNTKLYTSAGAVTTNFIDTLIARETFVDLTYFEVFEQVFGPRLEIVFDAGAWWVRNIPELGEVYNVPGRTTTLTNYNAAGVRGSSVVYRPEITKQRKAGGTFGRLLSQKNIVIERIETPRINYVPNNQFREPLINFIPPGWTFPQDTFSYAVDTANGWLQVNDSTYLPALTGVDNQFLQSTPVTWNPYFSLTNAWVAEKMFLKVDGFFGFNLNAGRYQIVLNVLGQTTGAQYLTADNAWSSTPAIYSKSGNFEVELPIPPLPGSVTTTNFDQQVQFEVRIRIFRPERRTSNSAGANEFARYNEISLFKDSRGEIFGVSNKSDYRANEKADRDNRIEVQTLISQQNNFPYRHGGLLIDSTTPVAGFESAFGLGIAGTTYDLYLSQSYLGSAGVRQRRYDGAFFDSFNFTDVLAVDSAFFRVSRYVRDIKSKNITVTLVQLSFSTPAEIALRSILDGIDVKVQEVINQINQNSLIPQDFNFQSQGTANGRTIFGVRPDTRFTSTNVTEMFLRVNEEDEAGVSIKPGASAVDLITPTSLVSGIAETIATREWVGVGFQPLDPDLTALAGLNTVGTVRRTGAGAFATMAGTVNTVPLWGAGGSLGNSVITQAGTNININAFVRIGTNVTPTSPLEIAGGGGSPVIRMIRTNPIAQGAIGFLSFGQQSATTAGIGSFYNLGNTGSSDLRFYAGVEAGSISLVTERMRINPSGHVLLNTTNDTGERLQVNGTARIATSLITPIIGNPAGVTANNTWNFSSNVNVPLLPTASAHATSKQYVDNLVATGIKEGNPVRTISLSNITLSGLQTVSGVALVAGDRMLAAAQNVAAQNGVYIVASGAWTRATDSDTDAELRGFQYLITAGTQINAKYRNSNTETITIGTTAITYVLSQGAETDPIFSASPAFGITSQNIVDWNLTFSRWGGLVPNDWWTSRFAVASTTGLAEGTNLYYTDARARAAISVNATGLTYSNGVIGLGAGRVIPLQSQLDSFLTGNQTIAITGDATGTGTTAIALTLANTGVSAGTYRSVTVDTKGRVLSGTNPTTLSGYGITDAQPLDADLTAIAALTATGTLRRMNDGSWNLYAPGIADVTGLQTALDAKQNQNTRLTALTNITGTGVAQWNGTAFTAGNIAITQVTDLPSTLDVLWILRDRDINFPLSGIRNVHSIDYHQARMDFGFDKTLDVPYLFYDTGTKTLVNYMDDDGVWKHVSQSGVERRYLREGDFTGGATPSLQSVSEVGRNSTLRLQFNGINYALETTIPSLQQVALQGANANVRLQFNGVGYATLAEIGSGGGGSVGTLGQVLAQGNNTNGIDINLNGFGVIRTQIAGGQSEILIGNNANIQLAAFNTIRTNATNVFTGAQTIQEIASSEIRIGTDINNNFISVGVVGANSLITQRTQSFSMQANSVVFTERDIGASNFDILLDQITIGLDGSTVRFLPNSVAFGAANVKYAMYPATFTNGQKYVFQYNSSTNTMQMVVA